MYSRNEQQPCKATVFQFLKKATQTSNPTFIQLFIHPPSTMSMKQRPCVGGLGRQTCQKELRASWKGQTLTTHCDDTRRGGQAQRVGRRGEEHEKSESGPSQGMEVTPRRGRVAEGVKAGPAAEVLAVPAARPFPPSREPGFPPPPEPGFCLVLKPYLM